jgi:hypothetical protein
MSGDVKVRVASHLSNLPTIATDASTSNFMELSTGVISKTGASAGLGNENTADVTMPRIARRMESFLTYQTERPQTLRSA